MSSLQLGLGLELGGSQLLPLNAHFAEERLRLGLLRCNAGLDLIFARPILSLAELGKMCCSFVSQGISVSNR